MDTFESLNESGAVTNSMCAALQRLQTVRSYDYERAYYEVFGGSTTHAGMDKFDAAMLKGKCQAIALWTNLQALRYA
jgi:hypothetical protein